MPSPLYDNSWLAARERTAPAGMRWDPSVRGWVRDEEVDPAGRPASEYADPVEEARAALRSAEALSQRTGSADLATVPARLVALRAENQANRPSLRGLTQPLAQAGQVAQLASLPALAAGPGVAGALGIGGTLAQVPDMLVRSLEEPQEAPGVLEGGLALLGLAPGIRGAIKAAKAGQMASRFPRVLGGPNVASEVAYANRVPSANPNQVLGVAREIAGETGDPLRKVLAGGRQNRYNRASQEALMRLATSGKRNQPARELDWMGQLQAEGRTVPTNGAMRQQAAQQGDAWSALRELATRSEGDNVPAAMRHRSVLDLIEAEAGPTVDLSDELSGLSDLDRAARLARARERFGRVYRSE